MILVNSGAFLSISSWFSELTKLIFVMIPYISSTGYPPTTKGIMGHVQVANCPLSRVLHVTLANLQRFGFEFHLRSSPSAFSEYMDVSQPADHFIACYTVLTRPNKIETAVHGCNLAFSLDSIMSLPR